MAKETCPFCGKGGATVKKPARYHYTQCGLECVWLEGGVEEYSCSKCGDKWVRVVNEQQLLQVIALMLLASDASLGPAEQKFLRKSCDMTQAVLATKLGMARRESVAERENGTAKMSQADEILFRGVLMLAFSDYIRDQESHLQPAHIMWLEKMKEAFLPRIVKLNQQKAVPEVRATATGARDRMRWNANEIGGCLAAS